MIGNLNGSVVNDLSVTDETGRTYDYIGLWNVNRTRSEKANKCGIVQKENGIEFRVLQNADYDPNKIAPFVAGYKGKVKLSPGVKPFFLYRFSQNEIRPLPAGRQTLDISLKMCNDMKTLVTGSN